MKQAFHSIKRAHLNAIAALNEAQKNENKSKFNNAE
jgi:hypothetical protein